MAKNGVDINIFDINKFFNLVLIDILTFLSTDADRQGTSSLRRRYGGRTCRQKGESCSCHRQRGFLNLQASQRRRSRGKVVHPKFDTGAVENLWRAALWPPLLYNHPF
jgi:hypothetical protein